MFSFKVGRKLPIQSQVLKKGRTAGKAELCWWGKWNRDEDLCPSGANAAGFATNSLLWGCACPIWLKKALPHVLMGPCAGDVLPEVNGSWQFIAPQPGIMLISAVLLCAGGFVSLCCVFFLFFYFLFYFFWSPSILLCPGLGFLFSIFKIYQFDRKEQTILFKRDTCKSQTVQLV